MSDQSSSGSSGWAATLLLQLYLAFYIIFPLLAGASGLSDSRVKCILFTTLTSLPHLR